ncbi:MAG: diguanylate cyclase (GGDEF)-like protein, partial [Alphaproteobacteria bacterium]
QLINHLYLKSAKQFYKNIFHKDRLALKNYLIDIDNQNNLTSHYVDIRYHYPVDDEVLWLRVQILNGRGDDQKHRYGSIQNITNDKSQLIKTAHTAYTDPLTGLINRERMKKKIALAIGTANEYNINHGIIAINIDYLSTINSMFGYQIANDLIEEVAKKISAYKRSSDIIARVSSGKFIVLLLDTKSINIQEKGERFLDIIRNTNFVTRSGIISITASGAGCHIPQDINTSDNAFAILDQCLTVAKQRGRDNFCQYNANIDNKKEHQSNIEISGKIIHAIQNNHIHTAYQSILHKDAPEKSFMECLARIKGSDGNFIPAYKFISIAESIGFIRHIDFKLLENAIHDLLKYPHLKLSINLSGHTLYNLSHNAKLFNLLIEHQQISSRLCLELTETIPLQDIENLDTIIQNFKKLGYKIALDDFGAGYNSFANLKHFDFDIVKIDGSYIKDIASNKKSQIFVQTLTDLARKLDIEVVAEMIDNEDDLKLIKDIGIDYYQGYYFTPPSTEFDKINMITYPDIVNNTNIQKKVI